MDFGIPRPALPPHALPEAETWSCWEALTPHLKGMGIECEARPCLPTVFPQPEPCCHLGLGEGTIPLAPSSWPTSPRLPGSRHHRLLSPSVELTHRLAPAGHTPDPWHHRHYTRVAPRRRGHRRRTTQRCNILALKTKFKKKLPRDALIFATTDSHYRLLGRGAGPGSAGSDGPGSSGETLKTRTLETIRPGTGCVPETGGRGSGERDTPATLPLVL